MGLESCSLPWSAVICSVNRLRGHTTTDRCFLCCCTHCMDVGDTVSPPHQSPRWGAAAGLPKGTCLKNQRWSYGLCLPRAQSCTVPRDGSGGECWEPLLWLDDGGGYTRLNTTFRCKFLSSMSDVAVLCL